MSITILFDLDDTLIQTNLDKFIPEYFQGLGYAFSHLATEKQIIQQIRYAVDQMTQNQDPGKMLKEVFSEHFYPPLGTSESACQKDIDNYYQNEYPKLQRITHQKPEAANLVKWCHSQNMVIAIATNPLFPKTATLQRTEWAGLNREDFRFISTFNDFHFTKPNLSYYAESLGRLGWPENTTVMVGDDLVYDLMPMEKLGFPTFWINPEGTGNGRAHGQLVDVQPWLKQMMQTDTHQLNNDPQVLMAILRSSPAVFDTWLKQTPEDAVYQKPSQKDWSFVEVLWHLADIEREVYQPQWEQLLSDPTKTITPVNISTWTETRKYQSRDSLEAFEIFLSSRLASLSMLEDLKNKDLFETSTQHSIFSRAKVSELVAFSVKHDQMHLRQCYNLLNIYKKY